MTYREIAYAISDFSKTISDDSIINIDHIIFLIDKYRNHILYTNFSSIKKVLSDANYQTICLDLVPNNSSFCGSNNVLISKQEVPFTLTIGAKTLAPPAGFMYGRIGFVNNVKFKYVGYNKFLKNEIYATIGPDNKLYLKSSNNNFLSLDKVTMTAIFSEPEKAAKLECNLGEGSNTCTNECDILDKHFPLDDAFAPMLMQYVVKDIVGASWRPKDDSNNATDDLARFADILLKYTNNNFKNIMNGEDKE